MRKHHFTRCYRCGKAARLFKCKHCGKYYCSEHSNPKMPLTAEIVFNEKDPILSQLYEKEWRKGGHACVSYGEWKLNEVKRQREIDNEILKTAIESISKVPIKRPEHIKYIPPKLPLIKRRNLKNIIKKITLAVVFLIILYLIYTNQNLIVNSSVSQYIIGLFKNYLNIDLSGNFILLFIVVLSLIAVLFFVSKTAVKVIITVIIAVFLVIFLVDMFRPSLQIAGQELGKVGQEISGKPEININELEKEIHNLVNIERTSHGLSQLQWDDKLSDIARKHSQDMIRRNFFSHDNPDGQDPTARANSAGYSCFKSYGGYYTVGVAENIFQNNLYDSITYVEGIPFYDWNSQTEIAESTVSGWMGSSGHRQNILTTTYDKEGIGVAISSEEVYITQMFC
jgi:uncharacterized protein YkwD